MNKNTEAQQEKAKFRVMPQAKFTGGDLGFANSKSPHTSLAFCPCVACLLGGERVLLEKQGSLGGLLLRCY
jgi:hypothetical protein